MAQASMPGYVTPPSANNVGSDQDSPLLQRLREAMHEKRRVAMEAEREAAKQTMPQLAGARAKTGTFPTGFAVDDKWGDGDLEANVKLLVGQVRVLNAAM